MGSTYTKEYLRAIDSCIKDASSFASLLNAPVKNRDTFAEGLTRQKVRDQHLEIVAGGERMQKANPRKRPREEA